MFIFSIKNYFNALQFEAEILLFSEEIAGQLNRSIFLDEAISDSWMISRAGTAIIISAVMSRFGQLS